MAYNPFNIFRRNQKAIFAVVTVFIMFTFVLSSGFGGKGDFFEWFPEWLGKKSRKGDHLATIDGTKVYDGDLTNLRFQRVMANRFMSMASGQSINNLRTYLREQAGKSSPEFRAAIQEAVQMLGLLDNPQFAELLFSPQISGPMLRQLDAITRSPTAKDEDRTVAQAAIRTFELAYLLVSSQGQFFVNAPNRNQRDLIDFMLWDKKAKQLGIEFAADDVKRMIQAEFMNQFRNDAQVRDVLQKEMPGFTLDSCLAAVGAEFRVRTCQTALLGPVSDRPDRTLTAAPVFTPPYDLFVFYRDRSSPTTYEVLAVPGASFAGIATGTPTDDELRRLYDKHKGDEPNPAKEDPGFKEPRKVKVEWVEVTGTEPYYKKAALEALNQGQVAAALSAPGLGGWHALTTSPVAAVDPILRQKYEDIARAHKNSVWLRWGTSGFVLPSDVLDTNVVKARNLAAATGGAAGSLLGFGGPFLPATLAAGGAIAAENRARVEAGMPLFLGVIPGPGMFATVVGAEARYRGAVPEPLPFEAYRPELFQSLIDHKAYEMAVADLRKLRDEIGKLTKDGKEKDKGPAKAYIAEFVKARGLKTGESKNLESEWTIGDDPGLEPLKAIDLKAVHGNAPIRFGRKFFFSEGAPQMGIPSGPSLGTYRPEFYSEPRTDSPSLPGQPEKHDPAFLTWRTEETPAKEVPFAQAKPKVVEGWKRIRGREEAKNTAEAVANVIRKAPGGSQAEILQALRDEQAKLQARFPDPKDKDRVKLFKLDNVAPLPNSPAFSMPGMGARGFALTASNDIPYPTKEMEKALLEDRTKPAKTTLVMADQPKDNYYVIVLSERREMQVSEFQFNVFSPLGGPAGGQAQQTILRAHASEAVRAAKESIMDMIKKEFNYVETDEQKKLLEKKEKSGAEE